MSTTTTTRITYDPRAPWPVAEPLWSPPDGPNHWLIIEPGRPTRPPRDDIRNEIRRRSPAGRRAQQAKRYSCDETEIEV